MLYYLAGQFPLFLLRRNGFCNFSLWWDSILLDVHDFSVQAYKLEHSSLLMVLLNLVESVLVLTTIVHCAISKNLSYTLLENYRRHQSTYVSAITVWRVRIIFVPELVVVWLWSALSELLPRVVLLLEGRFHLPQTVVAVASDGLKVLHRLRSSDTRNDAACNRSHLKAFLESLEH